MILSNTVLSNTGGGGGLTSPVAIADGGTGATTAANARTALGVTSLDQIDDVSNGVRIYGTDSADYMDATVDASGNALLAPNGATISLIPMGGSASTRFVHLGRSDYQVGAEANYWTFRNNHGSGVGFQFQHSTGANCVYMDNQGVHAGAGTFRHASVSAAVSASSTQTQGQQPLVSEFNLITVCDTANNTVTAPAAFLGKPLEVKNAGAETLQIFPASGDDLGAGVNTAVTLASGVFAKWRSLDATTWERLI